MLLREPNDVSVRAGEIQKEAALASKTTFGDIEDFVDTICEGKENMAEEVICGARCAGRVTESFARTG